MDRTPRSTFYVYVEVGWWRTRLEDPLANERAEPESSLLPETGWQPFFACFVDELTPNDERLLRTMLAELLQSP